MVCRWYWYGNFRYYETKQSFSNNFGIKVVPAIESDQSPFFFRIEQLFYFYEYYSRGSWTGYGAYWQANFLTGVPLPPFQSKFKCVDRKFFIENDHFDEALDVTNNTEEFPSPQRDNSAKVGYHLLALSSISNDNWHSHGIEEIFQILSKHIGW